MMIGTLSGLVMIRLKFGSLHANTKNAVPTMKKPTITEIFVVYLRNFRNPKIATTDNAKYRVGSVIQSTKCLIASPIS